MSKKSDKKSKDYSYPKPEDTNFQSNLYERREFYYHKVPRRDKFTNYEDIQEYRNNVCKKGAFQPREQQALLPNFLSPETPYKGVLLIHGVGSGKTATAIQVAEQFKDQAKKYNTKVFILTFGPASKEGWKSDLLFATRDTYLKDQEMLAQLPKQEKDRQRRIAINSAMQNYTILSYMTFYKKVLGEKISDKKLVGDDKIKTSYRRNEEGEIERELVVDRISNMDNSLIIVDEAHNLTGNEYGLALKKIIEKSQNLRVILLSATPMKNLADDIIELVNYLRPKKDPILREKVFTSDRNYMMQFKPGGQEYLQTMSTGYISYYRGKIPYTFAKQIDKGEVIDGLLFTHVVQCFMEPFQLKAYNRTIEEFDDALDRKSSSAANFVFPGFDKDKKTIIGHFSNDGINKVISHIDNNKKELIAQINKQILNNKISKEHITNFLDFGETKNLVGHLFKLDYLKNFSVKFYKCIKRLNRLVEGEKGTGIAFIYSNLVKAGGIEVFAECLKQNGYLEFQEDKNNYQIEDDTIDAITGLTFKNFNKKFKDRTFNPATYLLVTGSSEEGMVEDTQEEKQRIIREVYNQPDNIDGSKLKLVLGSKVMNEGVTLENVKEVHILDVHYNLGKVEQVIGRGIRMCKHQNSITESNKYPEVKVYRYVVSLKKELSSDEKLYQKAEKKYLLVKKVERLLKEIAIDCPLLLHSNMFPEEVEKYKGCVPPTLENKKKGLKICPELCDFEECEVQCKDPNLNKKYWDNKKKTYRDLDIKEINYGTYNKSLASAEIQQITDKIKDLYRFKSLYEYNEILDKVKKTLNKHQSGLFEDDLFNLALDGLMPETENEFNNFNNTVFDKFNRPGYLIQRNNYYIFQPFDISDKATMFDRNNINIELDNPASIKNYLKTNFNDKLKEKQKETIKDKKEIAKGYDFESIMEYYDKREEYNIVGIIEKNLNPLASDDIDNFKIRGKRPKVLEKKRGTGIPSLKGAVCSTSKDKKYLLKIIAKLPNADKKILDKSSGETREYMCEIIKQKLMYMEKYSTSKEGNKITYMMIPADHPKIPFPFNLEDRIKYFIDTLQKNTGMKLIHTVKKSNNGIFMKIRNKDLIKYEITFKNNSALDKEKNFIEKYGGKLSGKEWKVIFE